MAATKSKPFVVTMIEEDICPTLYQTDDVVVVCTFYARRLRPWPFLAIKVHWSQFLKVHMHIIKIDRDSVLHLTILCTATRPLRYATSFISSMNSRDYIRSCASVKCGEQMHRCEVLLSPCFVRWKIEMYNSKCLAANPIKL